MTRRHSRAVLLFIFCAGIIAAAIMLPQIRWNRGAGTRGVQVSSATFPMTVTDICARKITIKRQPKRIISIAPGITEILFAIGAGNRVIADTTYCTYPPAAATLPKIGGYLDPNVEKITALSPDLILGERGNRKEVLDHLYALGLPIVVVDPTNMQETAEAIRLTGRVTGLADRAAKIADAFDVRRRNVVSRLQSIPLTRRPRVLFLFSLDGGIFTVGPGSHIDELIRLGGGSNIAETTHKPWPQLSMETVVEANPQVILLLRGGMGIQTHGNMTVQKALRQLRADAHWRDVTAVRDGRLVMLDDDLVSVPGPRLIDGLEAVASALHPDLFPARSTDGH